MRINLLRDKAQTEWVFLDTNIVKEMIKKGLIEIVFSILFNVCFSLVSGLFVMLLWNWLMPIIFGLPIITYWQGWGISFLSGILLGKRAYYIKDK